MRFLSEKFNCIGKLIANSFNETDYSIKKTVMTEPKRLKINIRNNDSKNTMSVIFNGYAFRFKGGNCNKITELFMKAVLNPYGELYKQYTQSLENKRYIKGEKLKRKLEIN